MAKVIKYKFLSAEINHGTEENPSVEKILSDAEIACETQEEYDANYPIAEKEAVGEIVVVGEFEQEQPTQLDIIEAQVAYTAMMTDTLLEV